MVKIQKNFSLQTKQAVLIIDQNAPAYQFLNFHLFRQPLIFHLLNQFFQTATFINDLIIVINEDDQQIRQTIKQYALQKPVKIRVFSTKNPLDFSSFLVSLSPFVQPSFFFGSLCSLSVAFQIVELSQWQANTIFAVDQKENLLHTYLFSQSFLKFLDESQPDLNWQNLLAQYAQLQQVKNVVFDQEKESQQKQNGLKNEEKNRDFWLDYCQKSLTNLDQLALFPAQNLAIAPTTRLHKNNLFEDGVQIGEYCVIENCYLGKNCQIGNFCHLQNTIIEDNCHLTHYINLQQSYLSPKTTIDKVFQSYQAKILSPNQKEKKL